MPKIFHDKTIKLDRYQKQILREKKDKGTFKHERMDERFNNAVAQMSKKDFIKLYRQVVGKDDLLEWYKKEVGL